MEKERKSRDDFPHFIVSEVQPGETFPTYIVSTWLALLRMGKE